MTSLTDREKEVLSLAAEGYAEKEIAGELGISAKTVANHVHNVLQKLNAKNKLNAVVIAFRKGEIDVKRSSKRAPHCGG